MNFAVRVGMLATDFASIKFSLEMNYAWILGVNSQL